MNCYDTCADIPWYKFQQRKICIAGCDASAFQMQQNEIQETFQLETEQTSDLYAWLFPTIILLVVLVIVAKWQGWI